MGLANLYYVKIEIQPDLNALSNNSLLKRPIFYALWKIRTFTFLERELPLCDKRLTRESIYEQILDVFNMNLRGKLMCISYVEFTLLSRSGT